MNNSLVDELSLGMINVNQWQVKLIIPFQVRIKAQENLKKFFTTYPRSHAVIVDDICEHLKSPNRTHEQYRGILGTLSLHEVSLLTFNDWKSTQKLWPALIGAPHSGENTIVELLGLLQEKVRCTSFHLDSPLLNNNLYILLARYIEKNRFAH